MAFWWRQGTTDTCNLLQSLSSVACGRKWSGGGWQGCSISSCRFYKMMCPHFCNIIATNLLKRPFPTNINGVNSGIEVRRAGNIFCGSFSINQAAGMSSEADWNTIQHCRIHSFHHHKFSCSLLPCYKKHALYQGEKRWQRYYSLLWTALLSRIARAYFLRRDFSSHTFSPTILLLLIMFLWDKSINVWWQ